jgi:triacylglycerol lipase
MNRYPIVLAHGIARFDFLTYSFLKRVNLFLWDWSRALDRLHYFNGVASHLQQHGFEVYKTSVRFAAGAGVRARDLRQEILRVLEQSQQEKVHIIGHSMGGLDARHMIVDEEMADKVASLTTIGTPHLGTSFAEWGLSHGGHEAVAALRQIVDLEGFLTLTRTARATFNERVRNREATNGVVYRTYASHQEQHRVFAPIQFSWGIIFDEEGENDGLVPAQSQAWMGELVSDEGVVKPVHQHPFPVPADHLNQVAWWDLEELRRPGWWRLAAFREKRKYEEKIRNVYLQIARDVSALPE